MPENDADRKIVDRMLGIIEAGNLEMAEMRARAAEQDRRMTVLEADVKAGKVVAKTTADGLTALRNGVYGEIGNHASRESSVAGRVDKVTGKMKVLWIVFGTVAAAFSAPMLKNLAEYLTQIAANGSP